MFKFASIVLFAFIIKECTSSSYDEARDLLIQIKVETGKASSDFKNNITRWMQESDDGQKAFVSKIEEILDKKNYETVEKLKEAEKEAEAKGPDAVLCVTNGTKSLEDLRQYADHFISCTTMIGSAVERNVVEIQSQISWITDEILDIDAKFVACGDDESCFEGLIPDLKKNLLDLPGRIQEKIQYMDEYVKNCEDSLITCDQSATFVEDCDKLYNNVIECIANVL